MSAGPNDVVGAYRHWDEQWRRTEGISAWAEPDPDVITLGRGVLAAGGRRCLDVGCGIGRHALALAGLGYEAHAVDRSEAGLARVDAEAGRRGLTVATRMSDMTSLPYPDETFDLVIAWNVIYHGTGDDAGRAASEITRVLRPGGRYLSTMLSKHNVQYGKGERIAPDVFVQYDGPEDKSHPHLYTDMTDVLRLHPGLRLTSASDREHGQPGSYHWHLVFEKPVST
jgi:SAM-dependent methyltransferase